MRTAALELVASVVSGLGPGDRSTLAVQSDALKYAVRAVKDAADASSAVHHMAAASILRSAFILNYCFLLTDCNAYWSKVLLPFFLAMIARSQMREGLRDCEGGCCHGWLTLRIAGSQGHCAGGGRCLLE